jgi:hypothetical protein
MPFKMEHLLHIADLRQEIFDRLDARTLACLAQTCRSFRTEAREAMKTNVAIVNKVLDLLEHKAQHARKAMQVLEEVQYTFCWWYHFDFKDTPMEALTLLYDAVQSSNDVKFHSPHEFVPTLLQYLLVRDDDDLRFAMIDCLVTTECARHADRRKDCCRAYATTERDECMGRYIKMLLDRGFFHAMDVDSTKTYVVMNELDIVRFLLDRESDPAWSEKIENVCIVLQNDLLRYYARLTHRLGSFRALKRTAATLVEKRIGSAYTKHPRRYSFRKTRVMRPCLNASGNLEWSFFLSAEV